MACITPLNISGARQEITDHIKIFFKRARRQARNGRLPLSTCGTVRNRRHPAAVGKGHRFRDQCPGE